MGDTSGTSSQIATGAARDLSSAATGLVTCAATFRFPTSPTGDGAAAPCRETASAAGNHAQASFNSRPDGVFASAKRSVRSPALVSVLGRNRAQDARLQKARDVLA
jgi:hypothetical protein